MIRTTYPPPFQRWMITITVMLVAIIEVLDMTIVTVALPHMMGSLGANADQITWILTSYIVTSAIFMLLTGFFEKQLGRQRLLLICISGFILFSALCGISTNLREIVIFRSLQGMFGAGLVPLSQTVLRNTFPPDEQGKAMAIWSIGIMVAPVLGPTLGGYITEHLTWRWIFYINVPICSISFLMALRYIQNTAIVKTHIDWLGAILMGVGVGALQLVLDQGNNKDWFQSHFIVILTFVAITFGLSFIIRGIKKPDNIISFNLFRDRNFAFSTIMMVIFTMGILGIIAIQPILLENYFNYPTEFTGLVMAPRGIAAAIGMMFVGALINKFDPRKMMFLGLISAIIGTFMMSGYNLQTSPFYWIYSAAVQGFGMGLFFVPLVTISLSTLPQHAMTEGAGLFSFSRNLGSSIGISLLSTIITREAQINWNRLGSNINPFNENLKLWLNQNGWQLHDPIALSQLQQMLTAQSGMIAYIDSFYVVGFLLILLLPFVFLIKQAKINDKTAMVH